MSTSQAQTLLKKIKASRPGSSESLAAVRALVKLSEEKRQENQTGSFASAKVDTHYENISNWAMGYRTLYSANDISTALTAATCRYIMYPAELNKVVFYDTERLLRTIFDTEGEKEKK